MAQNNENFGEYMALSGIVAVICIPVFIVILAGMYLFLVAIPLIAVFWVWLAWAVFTSWPRPAHKKKMLIWFAVTFVIGVILLGTEGAREMSIAAIPFKDSVLPRNIEPLAAFYRWCAIAIIAVTPINACIIIMLFINWKAKQSAESEQPTAPMSAARSTDGESGGEFSFDPTRYGQRTRPKPAPTQTATNIVPSDAKARETDERLWAKAMDENTPEPERQSIMRAIRKRGRGFDR